MGDKGRRLDLLILALLPSRVTAVFAGGFNVELDAVGAGGSMVALSFPLAAGVARQGLSLFAALSSFQVTFEVRHV